MLAQVPKLTRFLTLFVLSLAIFTNSGCKRHRNDPLVREHPLAFHWDARLVNYNQVDEENWYTIQDWAYVEFEAFDFHGEIMIEIYDDHDDLIFRNSYVGTGGDLYALDETLDGDEGDWYIVITGFAADGFVDIDIY